MANCEPAGMDRASSAIVSRHSGLVTASAWSRTMATGWLIDSMEDTNGGTTVMAPPGEAKARNTAGLTLSTRSKATAR